MKYKREIIELELEKSRLNREKCALILNKSVFLYFTFMFIGVIGFVNGYIKPLTLNLIIILGLFALIVGTAPYMAMAHKEHKNLTALLEELKSVKHEK
jgi:hypothetical protein